MDPAENRVARYTPVMYRPVRTFALVIAAIAVALTSCMSYVMPLSVTLPATDRHCVVAHWFDGRMRVFWIQSPDDPIRIQRRPGYPPVLLDVVSPWPGEESVDRILTLKPPDRSGLLGRIRASFWIGSRRDAPAFGFQWPWRYRPRGLGVPPVAIRFVRFPMWVPGLLLLVPAAIAVHRGPRRQRHRFERGLCAACGYDLRGLPEPRCPECGSPMEPAQRHASVTEALAPDEAAHPPDPYRDSQGAGDSDNPRV